MGGFLDLLELNIDTVKNISHKIENHEAYLEDIRGYLPSLNEMITSIFTAIEESTLHLELSQEFTVQVLNDVLYGMEHEDEVFLLDVLRYGLLEIYLYIKSELQGEETV